jgi:hypothetical protein
MSTKIGLVIVAVGGVVCADAALAEPSQSAKVSRYLPEYTAAGELVLPRIGARGSSSARR